MLLASSILSELYFRKIPLECFGTFLKRDQGGRNTVFFSRVTFGVRF